MRERDSPEKFDERTVGSKIFIIPDLLCAEFGLITRNNAVRLKFAPLLIPSLRRRGHRESGINYLGKFVTLIRRESSWICFANVPGRRKKNGAFAGYFPERFPRIQKAV